MKCSYVIQMIWDKKEAAMIEQRLMAGLNSLMSETKLEDDRKIMESTFNRRYKFIKTTMGTEPYWVDSWIKEVWCRIRCGNIVRAGKKGFKDWQCRLCQNEDETLEHIFRCRSLKAAANEKIRGGVAEEWRQTFDWLLMQTLRGDPIKEICEYIQRFENLVKAGDIAMEDELVRLQ
ncbi:Protein of unknown function [Cotesia congregata]|uniref:Uncharacterized protein n=1 Tax=Cotesia congregata TaxID=51543 RepID=A0A8J2MFX7_COTCN|nr:Protein of unknown function [Cotesia congregata]